MQLYTNKRLMLALVLIVVLVLVVVSCGKQTQPIKIGVLQSLTGTMAISEAPLADAVRLAVEELNAAGGLDGRPVEMVVADCRSDAGYCAQQAEKLISQDKAEALFGCWISACRKAIKPIVEKYHHLLFYPLQYEGMEQSPNIVYTGATPNQQVIPMVSWALQQRGKRVYLLGSDYVFPRTVNRIVKYQLQALSAHLLAERYVPLAGQDFSAIVREIKALHPDFVLNTLNGDSNRYFFQALQQAGLQAADIPVFSTSIAEAELAAIGPGLVVGHYAAWNYFQSIDSRTNQAFVARFRNRFGPQRVIDDPMESIYVAVRLWANAWRNADVKSRDDIKVHLEKGTLDAPEGIVAIDRQKLHVWKTVRIGRAKADGQFEIVWQSGRSIAPAPFPFFIPSSRYDGIVEEP